MDYDEIDSLIYTIGYQIPDRLYCNRELYEGFLTGDLDLIKYALQNGAYDVDRGLKYICKHTTLDIIKFLIEECKVSDKYLNEGLFLSCGIGNLDIAKYLVEHGANDFNGGMHDACRCGHLEMVKYMIECGAVDFNVGFRKACWYNQPHILKYLVEVYMTTSTNVLEQIKDFNAGFIGACYSGNLDMVKYLVKLGANQFTKGFEYACHYNNRNIIDYLIELGVNNFNIGLREACCGGHLNIVEYMVALGANSYQESLSSARNYNNIHCLKFLINYLYDNNKMSDENIKYINSNNVWYIKDLLNIGVSYKKLGEKGKALESTRNDLNSKISRILLDCTVLCDDVINTVCSYMAY